MPQEDRTVQALLEFALALETMSGSERRACLRWLIRRYELETGVPAMLLDVTEQDYRDAAVNAYINGDLDVRDRFLSVANAMKVCAERAPRGTGMSQPRHLCSHQWIDPRDPPIARAPYSPVIGPRRREMKYGTPYVCRHCEHIVRTPPRPQEPSR